MAKPVSNLWPDRRAVASSLTPFALEANAEGGLDVVPGTVGGAYFEANEVGGIDVRPGGELGTHRLSAFPASGIELFALGGGA